MAKMTNWRISCPSEVRLNQMIALETETFFVLRQNGPLSFTIQDLYHEKPFEVRLGDPHVCSCRLYKLSQDVCSHICWIILKKFKIHYRDPLSFQRGISTREIGNLFADKPRVGRVRKLPKIHMQNRQPLCKVPKKNCGPGDTCAICLEQFSFPDNVTYCKYSCGNVVHIRCIQMLIKHTETQKNDNKVESNIQMLKCPLCRGNFNALADLKIIVLKASRNPMKSQPLQEHPVTCAFCRSKPIRGNLYRCLDCIQILLCGACLKTQDFLVYHKTHNYAVKKKSGGPWRRLGKVEEHLKAFNTNGNFLLSSSSFSSTANRRNTAEYKNLLEFSKGFSFNCDQPHYSDNVYKNKANALKTDRHFVKRNYLCAVCTDAFEVNTYILATTCGHYFHSDCMEEHMNDSINEKRCPLDNIQIHYSPLNRHKPIKWAEKSQPQKKETDEINLGPLEVRVSRMHLEQRPKDSFKSSIATPNIQCKNATTKQSKHRNKLTHKECKQPIVQHEESNLDERLLSAKVNPLMTILMSPHLKQYIEQEEKRDQPNDANSKRKSLNKIKVKSLEFPDDSNASRVAKLQKSRSTPSPSHWVQKTLKCKIADGQTRPIKRCDL